MQFNILTTLPVGRHVYFQQSTMHCPPKMLHSGNKKLRMTRKDMNARCYHTFLLLPPLPPLPLLKLLVVGPMLMMVMSLVRKKMIQWWFSRQQHPRQRKPRRLRRVGVVYCHCFCLLHILHYIMIRYQWWTLSLLHKLWRSKCPQGKYISSFAISDYFHDITLCS